MGICLNPGSQNFQSALASEIFVDKTELIRYLNYVAETNQKYICVTRPYGFGKTMAADMICAYYDRTADSRALFENTLLAKGTLSDNESSATVPWDINLGKFDIIRIVITDFTEGRKNVKDVLSDLTNTIVSELTDAYPEINYEEHTDLNYILATIYLNTGRTFVVVIDEWDAIFRIWKDDKEGQIDYLHFLNSWIKDKAYIALAYITGILPIRKFGEQTVFNMFSEYSMTTPLFFARYTGFTEKEVMDLCKRYGRDFCEIKEWYGGYFAEDANRPDLRRLLYPSSASEKDQKYSLYCPLSVVNAIKTGVVRNYWNVPERFEDLRKYFHIDSFKLQKDIAALMKGDRVRIDISTFQNDMVSFRRNDDVLSLLIHLGYLSYESEKKEVFLPNKEVRNLFYQHIVPVLNHRK